MHIVPVGFTQVLIVNIPYEQNDPPDHYRVIIADTKANFLFENPSVNRTFPDHGLVDHL